MIFSAICWPRCLCSHWQMATAASCGDEEMLMGISPMPGPPSRLLCRRDPPERGLPATYTPLSKSCRAPQSTVFTQLIIFLFAVIQVQPQLSVAYFSRDITSPTDPTCEVQGDTAGLCHTQLRGHCARWALHPPAAPSQRNLKPTPKKKGAFGDSPQAEPPHGRSTWRQASPAHRR